ncbi:hypothetical protein M8998_07240 [Sphingobacterium sp. lm-10]|uniref:hypothetical protein n=1 Tax=Sphingobacterium sp. lm-10 TaxID=2944904 RepID=UPI002021F28F|nr:hypothetical protein [Sphingobacterium sp. lm-10]MCL7987728.1 hypothetical protein [Sphingobacterium sp. lm-10]
MTQREIANTFTDQPTSIGELRFQKWGIIGDLLGLYRKEELSISGLPLGKVQLIAAEFNDMMGGEQVEGMIQSDQINLLLKTNLPSLIKVIGIAASKGSEMPSKNLLYALNEQWTMPQLAEAISEVYRRLDLTTFFGIMALTKSLNLNDTQDREAHGQQLSTQP